MAAAPGTGRTLGATERAQEDRPLKTRRIDLAKQQLFCASLADCTSDSNPYIRKPSADSRGHWKEMNGGALYSIRNNNIYRGLETDGLAAVVITHRWDSPDNQRFANSDVDVVDATLVSSTVPGPNYTVE